MREEEARVEVKKQNSENSGVSLLFKGWKITLVQGHQPSGRALVSTKPDHKRPKNRGSQLQNQTACKGQVNFRHKGARTNEECWEGAYTLETICTHLGFAP